jgi:hypothetical protein
MIKKVQKTPENIYVASGYKEIGKSFELNRQRVANVVYSISRANTEAQIQRIDELVGTDGITDAEKPSLARELDAIMRDFEYLGNETRNANLIDSDEYSAVLASYNRLVELMSRIINSKGTYTNADVNYITEYYNDYTEKAITLENLILETTAELDRIAAYYAMTKVDLEIAPEAVAIGETCHVSAIVTFADGNVTSDCPATAFSFGITGLSDDATTSMFVLDTTTYPSATVTISSITNSAVVSNCKDFSIRYGAIGESGCLVKCTLTLDSDSMPF